jgi:hypothetical protein
MRVFDAPHFRGYSSAGPPLLQRSTPGVRRDAARSLTSQGRASAQCPGTRIDGV